MEPVILSVNYVGVQSEAPLERGGAGPWEALERILAQLCSGAFPSLAPWPQDAVRGEGWGPDRPLPQLQRRERPLRGCWGWRLTSQLSLPMLSGQAGPALTEA